MRLSILLNLFLALLYGIFSHQFEMSIGYCVLYFGCLLLANAFFRSRNKTPIIYYSFFFFVYAFLVMVTQIALIHDPDVDYYVHNDASDSFYYAVKEFILPCKWSEILEKTFLQPYFVHYPLSAFFMGFVGKLGTSLNIADLRLFLRLLSVCFGSLTMSVMAYTLTNNNIEKKRINEFLIPFGLFTYIYLASATFSRDIHVCLAYTLAAYACLNLNKNRQLIVFGIVLFLAAGFRPQNGLLFLLYPLAIYYGRFKKRFGIVGIISIFILLLVAYGFLGSTLLDAQESIEYYGSYTSETNKSDGIYMTIRSLPFPINLMIITVYILMLPLPIDTYMTGTSGTIFNIPFILSPYLMILTVGVCVYCIIKTKVSENVKSLAIVSLIIFFITVYTSPDIRRGFASIPGLYLCYSLVEDKCPSYIKTVIKKYGWTFVAVVSFVLTLYVKVR